MKHFITIITLFSVLMFIVGCGVSKQAYSDPVYDSIMLTKDNERHNYLPFEYVSNTVFQQVVIRAYIENGVLFFHINQSHIGKLVAHYKHITSKVDSTLTFSGGYVTRYDGYIKNYTTSYNCSITDKAVKRLSEDCFSVELNGTNVGNAKGFRLFCQNVYNAYHPVYLDKVAKTFKIIDVYNTETKELVSSKGELQNRISRLSNELSNANTNYALQYTKVCEQVKDSVKTEWLNYFFRKYSKSRFAFVSKIIDEVEYSLGWPNTAGGCDFKFTARNKSSKTVKYVNITVRVKNAVDDYVSCGITRQSTFHVLHTGPDSAGEIIGKWGTWENIIYNNSAREAIVTGLTIEYMDKSKIVLSGSDVQMMAEYNVLGDAIAKNQDKSVKLVKNRHSIRQLEQEVTQLEDELTDAKNDLFNLNYKIETNKSHVQKLLDDMKKQSSL